MPPVPDRMPFLCNGLRYCTVTRTYPFVQQHWSPEELSGTRQLST